MDTYQIYTADENEYLQNIQSRYMWIDTYLGAD